MTIFQLTQTIRNYGSDSTRIITVMVKTDNELVLVAVLPVLISDKGCLRSRNAEPNKELNSKYVAHFEYYINQQTKSKSFYSM